VCCVGTRQLAVWLNRRQARCRIDNYALPVGTSAPAEHNGHRHSRMIVGETNSSKVVFGFDDNDARRIVRDGEMNYITGRKDATIA